MKKIFLLYPLITLPLSWGSIKKDSYHFPFSVNSNPLTNQSIKPVSQLLLSHRGKIVCTVSALKSPGLVPSFFKIASPDQEDVPFNLPECDSKDISLIQNLTQQIVLLDEQGGYKVAAILTGTVAISTVLCTLGGAGGYFLSKSLTKPNPKRGIFVDAPVGTIGVSSGFFIYATGKAAERNIVDRFTKLFSYGLKRAGIAGMCAGIGTYVDYVIEFFY